MKYNRMDALDVGQGLLVGVSAGAAGGVSGGGSVVGAGPGESGTKEGASTPGSLLTIRRLGIRRIGTGGPSAPPERVVPPTALSRVVVVRELGRMTLRRTDELLLRESVGWTCRVVVDEAAPAARGVLTQLGSSFRDRDFCWFS